MSKNVAVFVDVANIFYAAKAAGVDIDYVTLLRSATAGRDLVRAYAYTGLDPENENQRQFHAFLSRSGYKVVSKDIRKYGDGRVKANLDIELVVDMMRLAEKLDIAVVVSGDGDFAPAITAVQQKGVRVEVISFRGNTSSDLIDVADTFHDITNLAKVEKGLRSGRRVAAEGDLSMTEVPDKESGVIPRRRRRGEPEERAERAERAERPARRRRGAKAVEPEVEAEAPASGRLLALPGEKLSRGADASETPAAAPEPPGVAELPAEEAEGPEGEHPGDDAGGRRRRRRRGGRGRGRGGRGAEAMEEPEGEEATPVPAFPDEVPTLPQHSGFGSVWDSQIGVPSDRVQLPSTGEGIEEDEDFEEEPEVPEYLLAEKRQGKRRDRTRGGRGARGSYRSALDRERFGMGSGYRREAGRGGRPAAPSQSRPTPPTREAAEASGGRDPWSEVPPEVQELLRAELARREGGAPAPGPSATGPRPTSFEPSPVAEPSGSEAEEKPKRPTRRRSTKTAEAGAGGEGGEATAEAEEKPKRPTRRRSTRKSAEAGDGGEAGEGGEA